MGNTSYRWRLLARTLGGLAVSVLFPLASPAQELGGLLPLGTAPRAVLAREEIPPPVENAPAVQQPVTTGASAQALRLSDCLGIALEQQPAIAAQRASLASADANRRGLENLRVPEFLVRELPIRRRQSALGVTAAAAGVDQAERETVYAVTRTYISVLYARQQQQVAQKVVTELSDALANAERLVGKEGAPRDLNQNAVNKNKVYVQLATARKADADLGVERAMAALREAMGVGPDFCFVVPVAPLPQPHVEVSCDQIVSEALCRRGELAQAVTVAEVTALEVKAQETSRRNKKQTFAGVVDLHSRPIPQGTSDAEYRPGALGAEMPTLLAGSRSARVERAQDLSARAGAVVDKTRNLIALEAQDTFFRWQSAANKVAGLREAANQGDAVARDTLNDFKAGLGVQYREVLEALILAGQARAQYNEVLYLEIIELAALERVTAGGFCAGLESLLNQS